MRQAYGPLFDADQEAQKLGPDRLKGLISQVAGVDADATSRIAQTFSALAKIADFDSETPRSSQPEKTILPEVNPAGDVEVAKTRAPGLRTEFHYNIQIHLPSNGDEETYLNIFNAIRKTFQ